VLYRIVLQFFVAFICFYLPPVILMANETRTKDLFSGIERIIGEWEIISTGTYNGSELTEYINGGAALFYSYNFKELVVRRYAKDKNLTVVVEAYKLDTPENAFGIYSFDTYGEHLEIGHEATYSGALLKFWKGSFLVRIVASYENEAIRGVILSLGVKIAQNIAQLGTKPDLLSKIPSTNIINGSITYFHEEICLNNIYYIPGVNLLKLSPNTEAVTYEYEIEGEILRIILIRYARPEDAKDPYIDFINAYQGQSSADALVANDGMKIMKDDKGKYLCARLINNYIIIVLEAMNKNACKTIVGVQEALL